MNIDKAYEKLSTLLEQWSAATPQDLSEADTRAKLLDPVWTDLLDWPESSIRREEPAADGFADYTLRVHGRGALLIEAKRVLPQWRLPQRDGVEVYKIGGPALADGGLQKAIKQAAGYGATLGIAYTVVTNGRQYVLFQSISSVPLRDRKAITFTDVGKLAQWRDFYEVLRCEAVTSASLPKSFLAHAERELLVAPLDFVPNADRDVPRNRLWSILNHLATRVLEDRPESRLELIQHCYIATRETAETDTTLRELIARQPPSLVTNSGAAEVRLAQRGRTSLGHALESAVKDRRAGVYVLTGGVGSGKTTFLNRFVYVSEASLVREYCAWFHIDFLPSGRPTAAAEASDSDIEGFIYRRVREQIVERYAEEIKGDGESLRTMFSEELKPLHQTLLYGFEVDDPHAKLLINQQIDKLFNEDRSYVRAAIRRLETLGRRAIFVLDNSDQLGEDFQERVFLIAKSLQDTYRAICIVSLREDKFYAAYYRGVFNAFPTNKFYIGSPSLHKVVAKRLMYGLKLLETNPQEFFPISTNNEALNLQDCCDLLKVFMLSVWHANRNIVRMMESVSGGNMRFALELFRDFVGSGNTDVTKILDIARSSGGYTVPFHEFAKSAILNNWEFYRAGKSPIVNVYARSAASRSSHFTALRVLTYLLARQKAASSYGVGFVDADSLEAHFVRTFDLLEDLRLTLGHLVRTGLVESEPPRAFSEPVRAYKVAASGAYYLRFLAQSFAYTDLVLFDTAIGNEGLARHLASTARFKDLEVRTERVTTWLNYLAELEASELQMVAEESAFASPIMPAVINQIEKEVEDIARRRASSRGVPPSARQ